MILDATTLLGIAGIVAALVGVWLGYVLQQGAEARRTLRAACAKYLALSLEAAAHLAMGEAEKAGGPKAPELRPDFVSDQYYATAQIVLASQPLAREAANLGDAVQAGIASSGSDDPDVRARGRATVMAAIGVFEAATRTLTRTFVQGVLRRVTFPVAD